MGRAAGAGTVSRAASIAIKLVVGAVPDTMGSRVSTTALAFHAKFFLYLRQLPAQIRDHPACVGISMFHLSFQNLKLPAKLFMGVEEIVILLFLCCQLVPQAYDCSA